MNHVPVSDFESRYQGARDPWRFATSPYEQRRYDLTVAALLRPRYERAFEPGCAVGELTRRLSARCDSVLAMDGSPTAVETARDRCHRCANITIRVGEVPDDWPDGRFDLVVLSELGYYFTRPELGDLRERAVDALEAGGTLVGVHWRGHSADHLLHGDEVQAVLGADPTSLLRKGSYLDDDFALQLWVRR